MNNKKYFSGKVILQKNRFIWRCVAAALSLATLMPLAVILSSLPSVETLIWDHLSAIVLPRLVWNTGILLIGVGGGVLLLGVPLAWLVAVYEFPGRAFFSWALMLPLALPAYVLAFVVIGIFDYTGPVQTWLRLQAGGSVAFPPIRSTGGVLLVMSLALYPYVYLLARNAFSSQGRRAVEVAASLGLGPFRGFWRVALPLARPWIIGGLSLALMEALADFGTVAIFNFDTFTTAIYKAWFSLFSLPAASQLASLLVLGVFILIWVEGIARGRRGYGIRLPAPAPRLPLRGVARWGATLWASAVLFCGFVMPVLQLLLWIWQTNGRDLDWRYGGFILNSAILASLAAILVVSVAVLLSYAHRRDPSRIMRLLVRLATLGYAVPGTVLAVGVFVPVAWLDNFLIDSFAIFSGQSSLLKGTLIVMLLAYVARFSAVGVAPVESAFARIPKSQEEAARLLGVRGFPLLYRVYLPQIKGGLLAAGLMVFVDTMKEMPITLMTRPFGWDTLSIRVFEMTSEGEWERAALPSVAIVLMGMVPVIWLARSKGRKR